MNLDQFFVYLAYYQLMHVACYNQDVAKMADWEDEQIEYIKERVTEEGRHEDLKKGKEPAQVLHVLSLFLMSPENCYCPKEQRP